MQGLFLKEFREGKSTVGERIEGCASVFTPTHIADREIGDHLFLSQHHANTQQNPVRGQ